MAFPALVPGGVERGVKCELLCDGHPFKETAFLENDADAVQLGRIQLSGRSAERDAGARGRQEKAAGQIQERGLPRAVPAEQSGDAAGGDFQGK